MARSPQRAATSFDANHRVHRELVDLHKLFAVRSLSECCEVNLERFCCDSGCE